MADYSISDSKGSTQIYTMPDGSSAKDINKGMMQSLLDPVGTPQPFSKEKTEEEKRAIEQLKQIELFNEGMDDLIKQVNEINKILGDNKKKAKETYQAKTNPDFGNVNSAIDQITGTPRKLSSFEANVLSSLKTMAIKAVTGHSIKSHDEILLGAVQKVIGELQNMSSTLNALITTRAAGGAETTPPGGREVPPTLRGTPPGRPEPKPLGEPTPLREAKPFGEALEKAKEQETKKLSQTVSEVSIAFKDIDKMTARYAGHLHIEEELFKNIIREVKEYATIAPDTIEDFGLAMKMWIGLKTSERIQLIRLADASKRSREEIRRLEEKIKTVPAEMKERYEDSLRREKDALHRADEALFDFGARVGEKFNLGFFRQTELRLKEGIKGTLNTRMQGWVMEFEALGRIIRDNVITPLSKFVQAAGDLNKYNLAGILHVGPLPHLGGFGGGLPNIAGPFGLGAPGEGVVPSFLTSMEGAAKGRDARLLYLRDMDKIFFELTSDAVYMDKKIEEGMEGWRANLYKAYTDQTKFYETFGHNQDVVRKQAIKNLRSGIVESQKNIAVTKTGLSLAHLIGTEAEHTADAIRTWVQNYNLSNAAAQNLANTVMQVGRNTGVTGENLLAAMQSAKLLVDQMKNLGVYSEETNKLLLQYSVTARQLGTEQLTAPIMQALQSRMSLYNAPLETRTFLTHAAANAPTPGVGRALFRGSVLTDKEAMKGLVKGMENVLQGHIDRITKTTGKRIEDLTADELDMLNTFMQNAYGMGVGGVRRTVETFKESSMSTGEKIANITEKLNDPLSKLSATEKMNLRERREQLELTKNQEKYADAISKTLTVTERMGPGGSVEQGLRNAGMTQEDLEKSLTTAAQMSGMDMKEIGPRIQKALRDPAQLKTLAEEIGEKNRAQLISLQQNMDPYQKAVAEINRKNNELLAKIEENTSKILKQYGDKAITYPEHLKVMAKTLTEITSILGKLTDIATVLGSIATAVGVGRAISSILGRMPGGGAGIPGGGAGIPGKGGGVWGQLGKLAVGGTIGAGVGSWIAFGAMEEQAAAQTAKQQREAEKLKKNLEEAQRKSKARAPAETPEIAKAQEELDETNAKIMAWRSQLTFLQLEASKLPNQFVLGLDRIGKWFGSGTGEFEKWKKAYDEMIASQRALGQEREQRERKLAILKAEKAMIPAERKLAALKTEEEKERAKISELERESARTETKPGERMAQEVISPGGWFRAPTYGPPKPEGALAAEKALPERKTALEDLQNRIATMQQGVMEAQINVMVKEIESKLGPKSSVLPKAVEAYLKMRKEKGAAWDPQKDPQVQAWNKQFEVDLAQAEKSVTARQNLQASRADVTSYMERMGKDATTGKMWKDFMLGQLSQLSGGTKFTTYEEAVQKASPEAIRTAMDAFTKAHPEKSWAGLPEGKGLVDKLIQANKLLDGKKKPWQTSMEKLSDAGTTPGSIYVKDMNSHSTLLDLQDTLDELNDIVQMYLATPELPENLLNENLVTPETAEEANENIIQRRLETEFAGTDTSNTLTAANSHLEEIAEYNRVQLEIQKQELETLKSILATMIKPSTETFVDTSGNVVPRSPPNYHHWAIRHLNAPNFGGVPNFPRA